MAPACIVSVSRTTGRGIAPVRRLWQYLVRQSQVQIIFVKFIFGRRGKQQQSSVSGALALPESQSFVTKLGEGGAESSEVSAAQQFQLARMQEPVKVIHKDRDAITAFCINKVSITCLIHSLDNYLEL